MENLWLTIYVLVWPVIVAGVLFVLVRAFLKDFIKARREGRRIV